MKANHITGLLPILIANLLAEPENVAPAKKQYAPRKESRADPAKVAAMAAGERFYYGRPCAVCGQTYRYTCNGSCVACVRKWGKTPKGRERKEASRARRGRG